MEKRETLVEFLDRTFVDRVENVSRKEREEAIEALKKGDNNVEAYKIIRGDIDKTTLTVDWLKENKDNLLNLEEFRFTKTINVIEMPAYLSLEGDKTLSPATGTLSATQKTKAVTVLSYVINSQMETHYFPEVVNLYAIIASPKIYDKNQVEEMLKEKGKVHVLPPELDNHFLVPKHEIRFSWNPEELQDQLATSPREVYEDWKANILKEVENAIENYESTFPYTKNYMIRGTHLERESLIKRSEV